tara:strand:- start:926 stop:1459 length:534 start_codon:yes stop_codon:yes gene_type:complete
MITPMSATASDAAAGEDVSPSDEDVPFSVATRTTPSTDGQTWELSLVMDDDAYENGTTFEITTQVCTNNGVCDPPVLMEATIDDKMQYVSLTPPSDHTYVNWRVKAIYSDDTYTNFPSGDWYTTWSSCYFQQDSGWGGVDYKDGKCDTGTESESIPGFSVLLAGASVMIAAAINRRD